MIVGEHIDFVKSIEIAQLALKHRPNRNQRQRIIALIYSPLVEDVAQLTALAKKAKKNSVAVDVVNIGVYENVEKLKTFIENVNSAENSHLVHVEIGAGSVADMVISSPINTAAMGNDNVGGAADNMGNVDPNMDPELAEAIRQSLEEQKQMLQAPEVKQEEKKEEKKEDEKQIESAPQEFAEGAEEMDEEEELKKAIMMSMLDKDAEGEEKSKPEVKKTDLEEELLKNQDFVSELIEGIPGISEDEKKKLIGSLDKKTESKTEGKEEEPKKEDKKEEPKKE